MVIGAFPAAKLGALLLKQVSKPIATVVKNQAKSSPVFRKYVCMPPAQFYNWCEIKAKMWILNLGKPVNIPVLSEAQAIELGANLLGEAIIFLIAAGILINEYNRSSVKEAAKEASRLQELSDIKSDIRELYIQAEEERAQIRELLRKLGDQHTKLEMLTNKIGIKTEELGQSPNEPPPYSPVNNDPNLSKINKSPEIYQLVSSNQESSPILLLRSVDEVTREFWNYPLGRNREESYVIQALYYLSEIFRFK
ncbi:optic atrophy 3 protein homolog [Anthonomus grandis grandis]|uniref:optic atrophy 3 protein homolog n=1 Tax=Anthonomus grandis grandis TaxID=2921223 RepID=UPI0021653BCD|nr:optic atrophy 3 protein homolog [Anthonomus grandis grandis]